MWKSDRYFLEHKSSIPFPVEMYEHIPVLQKQFFLSDFISLRLTSETVLPWII